MALPSQLRAPGLWLPVKGRLVVYLPYHGRPSANFHWLKELLGPGSRVSRGDGPSWEVARGRADEVRTAMEDRFGTGNTVLIVDSAQQQKCGPACQEANPANALSCSCSCGGENHGGVSSAWLLRDRFAIQTTHVRRVFLI